jgi:hypothetical protein
MMGKPPMKKTYEKKLKHKKSTKNILTGINKEGKVTGVAMDESVNSRRHECVGQ